MNHLYMQIDGEWHEVGGFHTAELPQCEVETDELFAIDCGKGYEFTIQLKRRQAQRLRQMFGIQKYMLTEAKFPRKKKRGTMRRKRKWRT